MQFNV